VTFSANGSEYTCYDFGKVLRFKQHGITHAAVWTEETGWVEDQC
jgi:hypothetical protein